MTTMTSPIFLQLHDFTVQFESGAFSDCRIKCNDRVWNLHKLILSARCQFFAGVLRNPCKESLESEIILEEQDPVLVDQALRYIYSCNLSHLDGKEADDLTGMKLDGYNTYIPLYIVADYLGLHALCKDLLSRLHRTNRRIAAHLQRAAAEAGKKPLALPKSFAKDFSECARLAYSIPAQRTEADVEVGDPGGLRSVFVELFEFARFRPLDETLVHLAVAAPLLLVDVMMRTRLIEGTSFALTAATCKNCDIHPLKGTGESLQDTGLRWPDAPTFTQMVDPSNGNFWVNDELCFKCSIYYPRKQLLFGDTSSDTGSDGGQPEEEGA